MQKHNTQECAHNEPRGTQLWDYCNDLTIAYLVYICSRCPGHDSQACKSTSTIVNRVHMKKLYQHWSDNSLRWTDVYKIMMFSDTFTGTRQILTVVSLRGDYLINVTLATVILNHCRTHRSKLLLGATLYNDAWVILDSNLDWYSHSVL